MFVYFGGKRDVILLLCVVGVYQHDFAHPNHPKTVGRHTLLIHVCRVLGFLKLAPFYVSTYAFVLLFNLTAPFELTPISTGIDVITMFSVILLA